MTIGWWPLRGHPGECVYSCHHQVAQRLKNFTETASNCSNIYFTCRVTAPPFPPIPNPRGGRNLSKVEKNKRVHASIKQKKFRNTTFLFLGCQMHLVPLNTFFSFKQNIGPKKEEG